VAANFNNDDDKKSGKAQSQTKPTWLTGFIGAEKESKKDAASLSKLSVNLKGKK